MLLLDKVKEYFVRKPDLRVLFVFDNGLQGYEQELPTVGDPQWPENYIYEVYDNRSFRVKYNLEHDWKDKKVVLLIKSDSPQDEQSRLAFPLLDVLCSNMEFKEDSAELFMQEHGIKHDFIDYVRRNVSKLQRKKNDDILKGYYSDLTTDILNRSIISADLDANRLLDWKEIFLKLIPLGREENAKKRDKFFNAIFASNDALGALLAIAQKTFGFRVEVGHQLNQETMLRFIAKSLKYNSLCGNLPLAKGDNYEQFKVMGSLDALNAIWDAGIKDDSLKGTLKELASDIDEKYILKVYGAEASYFRLTPGLAYPIAESLLEERLWVAPAEVNERIRSMLNKSNDERVVTTLKFLSKLCDFYLTKLSVNVSKLKDAREYVQAYADELYLFDMYYRQALELYVQFVDENPAKVSLEKAKKRLDADYAKFASDLNRKWVNALKLDGDDTHNLGFTCQENFYRKYRNKDAKQVVIISDALRYEIGAELMLELLKNARHHPKLEFALAQMPTETKFCKNALLPHKSLEFIEAGEPTMAVDGEVLATLQQREEHLQKYVDDARCVNFTDLDDMDVAAKRDLFKHSLVIIYHDAVDDSGHDHNAKILTKACRDSINDLARLIYSLHSTMNVRHVVVTADHGFLYDFEIAEKDKQQISESCIEKKTRYYLAKSGENAELIAKYPLCKVSAMQRNDIYVAVPSGTNRMAAQGGYNFAHGGNALQEIVIPVVVSHTVEEEKQKVNLTLLSGKLKMTSSILKVQILQKEAVSKEYKERTVECAVFDNGTQVTKEQRIVLNSFDEENLKNRIFEIKLALNKPTSSSILELKIWDVDDCINPLYKGPVTNDTLIEQDF